MMSLVSLPKSEGTKRGTDVCESFADALVKKAHD
jgi:hypothetical protein